MRRIHVESASIESLQTAIGKAIALHIVKAGTITNFAKRAGIVRQTLYRLMDGETVGTDILLRALRTLGRTADISRLLELPHETPLEKVEQSKSKQSRSNTPAPSLAKLKTAKRAGEG